MKRKIKNAPKSKTETILNRNEIPKRIPEIA